MSGTDYAVLWYQVVERAVRWVEAEAMLLPGPARDHRQRRGITPPTDTHSPVSLRNQTCFRHNLYEDRGFSRLIPAVCTVCMHSPARCTRCAGAGGRAVRRGGCRARGGAEHVAEALHPPHRPARLLLAIRRLRSPFSRLPPCCSPLSPVFLPSAPRRPRPAYAARLRRVQTALARCIP
eukprot:1681608-Rhodomonas_salina.1